MKSTNHILKLFFLCLINIPHTLLLEPTKNNITYDLTGGRFGDALLNYIKCKYFATRYDLSFFYKPFPLSDQLTMHKLEKPVSSIPKTCKTRVPIQLYKQYKNAQSVLYVSGFYSETPDDFIAFTLHNTPLRNELKKMIMPIQAMKYTLPKDKITVAVHVRRGGGFDRPRLSGKSANEKISKDNYIDIIHPLKFPPDSFYASQISFLSNLLDNRELYVYIFTDDKEPQNIVNMYKRAINKSNITFDYYKGDESFGERTVREFFFMKQFDCLIRPDSSFSIAAHIVGDHRIVLYPIQSHWEGNTLIIDEVQYYENNKGAITEKKIKTPKATGCDTPKVTIITSLYKGDEFIKSFLEDITQQTIFDQCELLIINANSPDNESPIIEKYCDLYPQIKYIKLDHDPGLYGVWNIGIKRARSGYVTNANVDDKLAHDCYEHYAKILDENHGIDLVYSDHYISRDSHETFYDAQARNNEYWTYPEFSTQAITRSCIIGNHPMWRTTLHSKAGLFNESFKSAGDWEMWIRAAAKGCIFKKVNEKLGVFYISSKSLSRQENHSNEIKRIEKMYKIKHQYVR
jgi:GT2 family glycosyltransferase